MRKIWIWNGFCTQKLEVFAHEWRALAPHPHGRLVQRAHGRITTALAPGNTWEVRLSGIDHDERVLSLGYTIDGSVPAPSKTWYEGYIVSKKMADSVGPTRYLDYSQMKPTAMWRTEDVPDVSDVWMGVVASGGSTVLVAGVQVYYGFVWKLGQGSDIYFIGGDVGAVGAGMGASAKAGFAILTGIPDERALREFPIPESELTWILGQIGGSFWGSLWRARF